MVEQIILKERGKLSQTKNLNASHFSFSLISQPHTHLKNQPHTWELFFCLFLSLLLLPHTLKGEKLTSTKPNSGKDCVLPLPSTRLFCVLYFCIIQRILDLVHSNSKPSCYVCVWKYISLTSLLICEPFCKMPHSQSPGEKKLWKKQGNVLH